MQGSNKTTPSKKNRKKKKISEIFRKLPNNFNKEHTTIGDIESILASKNYTIMLLLLAMLCVIPIPGLSTVMSIPMTLITFQLMIGHKSPQIPKFVRKRTIRSSHLEGLCSRIVPYIQKVERIITPRMAYLTSKPAEHFIAFICFMLSLVILFPIPLWSGFPATSICLFAIGIIQRDGMFIIAGGILTAITAALIGMLLGGLYITLRELLVIVSYLTFPRMPINSRHSPLLMPLSS